MVESRSKSIRILGLRDSEDSVLVPVRPRPPRRGRLLRGRRQEGGIAAVGRVQRHRHHHHVQPPHRTHECNHEQHTGSIHVN